LKTKLHHPFPKDSDKDKQLLASIPKLKQVFKGINIPMPPNPSPIPIIFFLERDSLKIK
jgi:hypothetical protein